MSIDLLEDTKNLEASDDVLDTLAGMGQDTIVLALLVGQWCVARRLVWCQSVRVVLPETLISCITDQCGFGSELDLRVTKEGQIVHGAERGGDGHDHVRRDVNQNLHLQCVTFLLAAVPAALVFFGRSQGTSEASTAMML